MSAIALSALQLNVVDHDRSVEFFKSVGFVEDIGARSDVGGRRHAVVLAEAAGVTGSQVGATTSLMHPHDPFMHLEIQGWDAPRVGGWPRSYDQLGGARLTLLVDDLDAEVDRLQADGVEMLLAPTAIGRRWGESRSSLLQDPDGTFVELLEIQFADEGWDTRRRSVTGAPAAFLHFHLNTDNRAVAAFYKRFGFEHDDGPFVRPDAQPGSAGDFEGTWGFDLMAGYEDVDFLRLPTDHSHMHLEVMNWKPGHLVDPAERPTFNQRGIMRVCFKVADMSSFQTDLRARPGLKRSSQHHVVGNAA